MFVFAMYFGIAGLLRGLDRQEDYLRDVALRLRYSRAAFFSLPRSARRP
jgi:hypothetical protein